MDWCLSHTPTSFTGHESKPNYLRPRYCMVNIQVLFLGDRTHRRAVRIHRGRQELYDLYHTIFVHLSRPSRAE